MDGWVGGWVGGWVDGWMDGWMDVGSVYICVYLSIYLSIYLSMQLFFGAEGRHRSFLHSVLRQRQPRRPAKETTSTEGMIISG